jgi:MFS family permease
MASGAMTIGYLVVGGFLIGLTFAFLGPTRAAYSVELVEAPRRGNAMALNQVALNASRVVGPALGGLLLSIDLFGATGAFLAMGLLYALAVLWQTKLPSTAPLARAQPSGLFADVWDGLAYVRGRPRLRTLVGMFMLIVMLGMPHVTVLPGLCENQLGLPTTTVSLLFSVSAAGGLLASLVMAPLADTPNAMRLYIGSGLAFGVSLCALWKVEQLWSAAAVMFALGLSTGGVTTMNGPIVMRQTDSRYMGRVMSLTMLSFGASGLVGLPVGALADVIGEGATLALCGVAVCLVVTVLGLSLRRYPELAPQP